MFQFILAALFVELTPGPNMAYLATLALARGRGAALIATLGVALGLSVHAVGRDIVRSRRAVALISVAL